MTEGKSRDTAGIVIAALMILLGAIAWWDTTTMEDADSFVFPRAVIIAMVAFSLMLILTNLLRPGQEGAASGSSDESHIRRVLLVICMLAGAAAMPYLGFLLSGLLVFAALTGIAMFDPWTKFRMLIYPLSGIAIVTGFYLLFAELLLVPLPVGILFE
jgi:hypothetical protein